MHKYDGFVYPEPSLWLAFLPNWISSGSPLKRRRAFLEEFFPKWSGFCVGVFDSRIQPLEALEQLHCLVWDISEVWTVDTIKRPRRFSVYDELNISEVGVTCNQQTVRFRKSLR